MSKKVRPISSSESSVSNRKLKRFRNITQMQEFAESNDLILVVFEKKVYDLTDFQYDHPGGSDILEDSGGQDITDVFFNSVRHKHSKYALSTMQKYLFGDISLELEQDGGDQSKAKSTKKEYPLLTHDNKLIYDNVTLDLNKGLLHQIITGTNKNSYENMLKHPCKRVVGTKLFSNEFLDTIFNNNIGIVITVYLFLFGFLIYNALDLDNNYSRGIFDKHIKKDNQPLIYLSLLFTAGFLIFWVMEFFYLRLVLQPFSLGKTLHFFIFGIHYIFPLDDARTTVQPIFSLFVGFILRFLMGLFIYGNTLYLILSGICFGYILYEIIHYAIHTKKVLTFGYSQYLRQKHAKHHFKDRDYGYQVTNHFWDRFFELNNLDEDEKHKDIFGFGSDSDDDNKLMDD